MFIMDLGHGKIRNRFHLRVRPNHLAQRRELTRSIIFPRLPRARKLDPSVCQRLFFNTFCGSSAQAGRGTKVLLRMRKLSALITSHVCDHLMKFLKILALSVSLFTTAQAVTHPSFLTKGTPTGKLTGPL